MIRYLAFVIFTCASNVTYAGYECSKLIKQFYHHGNENITSEGHWIERENWAKNWFEGGSSYNISELVVAIYSKIEENPELRYNEEFFPIALIEVASSEMVYWDYRKYKKLISLIDDDNLMMLFDKPSINYRPPISVLGVITVKDISNIFREHIYNLVISKENLGVNYGDLSGEDYIDFIDCWINYAG